MTISSIITAQSITVLDENFVPKSVPSSHPNFEKIRDALEAGAGYDVLSPLLDLPSAVIDFMEGSITIADGVLFFNERPLENSLTSRILAFIEAKQEGLARPLINFLTKVMENPSRRAVQGLHEWTEKSNLPIHPDGDLLAWKIVNDDYTDCYTGRFDNSIGQIVEVPRNDVDEDPDRTCSYGLHFCSTEYLPNYGPADKRVVVVKLNPADVVAFPRDYNTSKGRACRYEVVGEVPADRAAEFFPDRTFVYGGDFSDIEDEDEIEGDFDFEVGQTYETRRGTQVTVTSTTVEQNDAGYVVEMSDGGKRTADGQFFPGMEDPDDLVRLVA
jgi:hypothetical protein